MSSIGWDNFSIKMITFLNLQIKHTPGEQHGGRCKPYCRRKWCKYLWDRFHTRLLAPILQQRIEERRINYKPKKSTANRATRKYTIMKDHIRNVPTYRNDHSEDKHNHETGYDIRMILDDKFVAEHRRFLGGFSSRFHNHFGFFDRKAERKISTIYEIRRQGKHTHEYCIRETGIAKCQTRLCFRLSVSTYWRVGTDVQTRGYSNW